MDNISQIFELKSEESYKIFENSGSLIHLLYAADLNNIQALDYIDKNHELFNNYFTNDYLQYLIVASYKGYGYAMNNLGYLYHYGLRVKQDFKKAKEYYEKSNTSYSMNNLGYLYHCGLGVEQDFKKAEEYYKKSGIPTALKNLKNLKRGKF